MLLIAILVTSDHQGTEFGFVCVMLLIAILVTSVHQGTEFGLLLGFVCGMLLIAILLISSVSSELNMLHCFNL